MANIGPVLKSFTSKMQMLAFTDSFDCQQSSFSCNCGTHSSLHFKTRWITSINKSLNSLLRTLLKRSCPPTVIFPLINSQSNWDFTSVRSFHLCCKKVTSSWELMPSYSWLLPANKKRKLKSVLIPGNWNLLGLYRILSTIFSKHKIYLKKQTHQWIWN